MDGITSAATASASVGVATQVAASVLQSTEALQETVVAQLLASIGLGNLISATA
jgi:hypothetical protein